MRGRTFVILGLAVLLLAVVVWLDRERPGSDERRQQAELLLPGLEPDRVQAVVLEPPLEAERPPVHLDRVDGGWQIVAPRAWAGRPADASAVDEMLASLAALRRQRELEGVVEAEVGLDRPRARLLLERRDGAALLLEVGGEVPASRSSVLRVSELDAAVGDGARRTPRVRGVYLVDGEMLTGLVRPEWRDRELFHYSPEDVLGLTLEGPEGRVELARRSGGPGGDGFDVVSPVRDAADDERVASLLTTLEQLTADRFVDGDGPADDAAVDGAADMGLDPPLGTVTVELQPWQQVPSPDGTSEPVEGSAPDSAEGSVEGLAEGAVRTTVAEGVAAAAQSLRITVGKPRPNGTVYLRLEGEKGLSGGAPAPGRPLVVATDTLLAEDLSAPPGDWISHRLTGHRAFDVTRMVVVDGAMRWVFDLVDEAWALDGEPVSHLPVSEVLKVITGARAAELLLAGAGAPGPVTRSVTLHVENGVERIQTIRFHGTAAEDGRVLVTVDGRPPVFVLDERQAERIEAGLQELREALLAPPTPQ